MGRKKIVIKPIENAASRRATFEKRRIGLLKKAMELSILCECTISVTIERTIEGDLQIYSSEPFDDVIERYQNFEGKYRLLTNDHIHQMIPGKMTSNSVGYTVRKQRDSNAFTMEHMNEHIMFQRAQMGQMAHMRPVNSMTGMEIIPSMPSPSLGNLYDQLQGTESPRHQPIPPTFNGYQQFSFNQGIPMPVQNMPMNPIPPPPPPPHVSGNKRSFSEMNGNQQMQQMQQMQGEVTANGEPVAKQVKMAVPYEYNSNNTSNTSTIEASRMDWNSVSEMPSVSPAPLNLQVRSQENQAALGEKSTTDVPPLSVQAKVEANCQNPIQA